MPSRTHFLKPGNREGVRCRLCAILLAATALLQPNTLSGEQVPVRQKEGLMHGFLALRTLQGKKIADGEMTQAVKEGRLTDHLIFHFSDGSIYEDTTIFTQKGSFRLLSDHLVEGDRHLNSPWKH